MAYVEKQISKKTGKIICYKWTALLGRDEHTKKQIRLTKRVEPYGLTPARELKAQHNAADEWEKEERIKYEKNAAMSPEEQRKAAREKEQITLVDFIDKIWMENHVKDGRHTPDTIAFYKTMSTNIKQYINTANPGIRLSAFEKSDVLTYLSYLRKDAVTKNGDPLSATTIQHHYGTLRNILEYAVYIDYIKENPTKKVKPSDRPRRAHKEVDFLDEEEAIKFLACLESEEETEYWKSNHRSPLFWQAMVNLLITTGLRRGELVGLQWGDIDRKSMMLHVQRNVSPDTSNKGEKDPEKKIHVGQLKGRGKDESRKVPISKYVLGLLDDYKKYQEQKFAAALLPNTYIFCRQDDPYLPLYPTEPTRLMRKFVKRHKLPNMSPHDLRHTAGYLAIESGANVKEIQALLGHRDAALSLKFYVGITEKAQQRTLAGIENLIRPKIEEEAK